MSMSMSASMSASMPASVSVSYWLQELQPLPFERPLFVSLNPLSEPQPSSVLGRFEFAHPVFDLGAMAAQSQLPQIQGNGGVWFAGAWAGYGFHEDGLCAGQEAAQAMLATLHAQRKRSDDAQPTDADETIEALLA
jgi:predicted NAD/FAD-binding protein